MVIAHCTVAKIGTNLREGNRKNRRKDWYKEGGYDSVMFIPATPGSALRKSYDQIVGDEGLKIRVVEKAGISLRKKHKISNPFKPNTCLGQTALSAPQGVMAHVI